MARIHVFIDTNVLLSFYALTHDDLEQLKKLIGLIKAYRLTIYVTQQVKDEFSRNRETKLNESLSQFEKLTFSKTMPRYIYEYKEAAAYRRSLNEVINAHKALAERARKEAESNSLEADDLLHSLFESSELLEVDSELIDLAQKRMHIGNPPGKKDSMGDQLNWEALIKHIDPETDLLIISNDGDYESSLNKGRPHQFLIDEWKTRKHAKLNLYHSLKKFLDDHFPEIKLAVDTEKLIIGAKKTAVINLLSFVADGEHNWSLWFVIPEIMERAIPVIDYFTKEEAEQIIDNFLKSEPPSRLASKPQVRAFFDGLIGKYRDAVDTSLLEKLEERLQFLETHDDAAESGSTGEERISW
jgi:predicted nucleic acid-binding protein